MKYDEVAIPKDKAKKEFQPDQRRAYIYEQICKFGHRSLINKRKLAEEFGVAPSSITNDLDLIDEELAKSVTPKARSEYMATWKMLLDQSVKKGDRRLAMEIQKCMGKYVTPEDEHSDADKEVTVRLVWGKKKEDE